MKITRTVFYCSYTNNNDDFPLFSPPFKTERVARAYSKKLIAQGFWGAIEKHHEFNQDYQNDYGWSVNWEGAGDDAIEMLDYF